MKKEDRASLGKRMQVLSKMETFLICVVIILVFVIICLLIDLNQANQLSQLLLDSFDVSGQGYGLPYIEGSSIFPGFTLM